MPTLQDLIANYGITEPFGVVGSYGDIHTGVDLGLPLGTPVPALGSGMIENVFVDSVGGTQVKVRYASGAQGWFAHLSSVYSQVGDYVDSNTIIGASGASGRVTGPHLHYEEHDQAGQLVDPLSDSARSLVGDTYIGGGTAASTAGVTRCPPGQVWNDRAGCIDEPPGGDRTLPSTIGRPGAGGAITGLPNAQAILAEGGRGAADVGAAIKSFGDLLGTGARQFAVAGVVIGAVVLLGYAGIKQVAD